MLLRYSHSIPLALFFFYLQNEKNDHFLFCFWCPICLPPDWESETRSKTFCCPWKTCGRAGATWGLAFDYQLNGCYSYIFRFASVVYMNWSFSLHAMSLPRVYNAFLGVAQRECPNSYSELCLRHAFTHSYFTLIGKTKSKTSRKMIYGQYNWYT